MVKDSKKRTFDELREIILRNLANKQKTINELSSETGINWKTVENHLTYLVGKALAREVFSSKFVRIFEITDKGLEALTDEDKADEDPVRFEKNGEVNIA